ncbi:MAG: TonB-dependent receptor, partial [Pseudomonadota bacterium]
MALFRTTGRIGLPLALAALLPGTAAAQTILEEITVTAQRRTENLQEVPISVTPLAGERLQSLFTAGEDIRALATRIPSLYAESSNGRAAPRFYIRGLGNTDFDLAASQSVSVIFDEVVQENVILKSFPLFDIQQVEVLRGPQGSLFGRNTPAGIVKFDTVKPSEEFDGYASVALGTLETLNFEGAVGGGLIEDILSARLSVLYQHRGDWIDNAFTNESEAFGGHTEFATRLQLLYTPTDRLDVLLNLHSRSLDGTASVFRANILTTGSNDLNQNFDRETVFFDEGDNNPQEYDGLGGSLRIDFDLNDTTTLTSITAHETVDGFSLGDIDGGFGAVFLPGGGGPGFIPFPSVTQDGIDSLDQFTQEFRLASDATTALSWQAGVFFFDSEFAITTNPFFIPATTVAHSNESWAVFGQASYDVSDRLTVTAGARYTDDEKDLDTPTVGRVSVSDDEISWDISALY